MTLLYTKGAWGKKRVLWLVGFAVLLTMVLIWCFSVSPILPLQNIPQSTASQKLKGVWLNYDEYGKMIDGCSKEEYQNQIYTVLKNMEQVGLNALFVHVRSHSDSFYPSSIFPWSNRINQGAGVDYDPLAVLLDLAHGQGIQVHAWLNPYRVSSGTLQALPQTHPAVKLKEKEVTAVVETETGVYYNPASVAVRSLVLAGVDEILANYGVDGIHYDDYFYPTTEESFDGASYEEYRASVRYPVSLPAFRQTQVNLLISATHGRVNQYEGVVFGVSPAAGIEKNARELYADVASWVKGKYVDYLCPQLYFGFDYPKEEYRFDVLLEKWQELAGELPLYIGIASYKLGQEDAGSDEWVTATDLLASQTRWVKDVEGVCFYHYSSLFSATPQAKENLQHLKKALQEF